MSTKQQQQNNTLKRPKQLFLSREEHLHQQLLLACSFGDEEMLQNVLNEMNELPLLYQQQQQHAQPPVSSTGAATGTPISSTTTTTAQQQQQQQSALNQSPSRAHQPHHHHSSSISSTSSSSSLNNLEATIGSPSTTSNVSSSGGNQPDPLTEILNRPNYMGQTALILCILHGHINSATRLLAFKNLSVNAQTFYERKNALMYAAEKGYAGLVVAILFFNSGNGNQTGSSSSSNNSTYILLDVDAQDRDGKTALMYACESLNFSSVQALLKGKPNVNLRDSMGRTALHYVICKNYSVIGTKWSSKQGGSGANNSSNNNNQLYGRGMTSGRSNQVNQSSPAQLIQQSLINAGIDVDVRDIFGKTAMDYANQMLEREGNVSTTVSAVSTQDVIY